MSIEFPRASWARANQASFDPEFKKALIAEIITAIMNASRVSDAPAVTVRTHETLDALVTCLTAIAAMNPCFDSPDTLQAFSEGLAKRVRREVAQARAQGRFDKIVLGAQRQGGRA
jgi:hypothetical protein